MAIPFFDLRPMHDEVADKLDDAWRSIALTGRFIGGEAVDRFEDAWAGYCGTACCVGLANGTSALELSLRALGIGAGDEVIVPTNTFIATASAVAAVGARVVFVDVDPHTLLMTAEGLADAVTARTAAVVAVHLYGQPVDMDAINEVAGRAGIAVIEDAAQAHGATWRGRKAGSLGRVGCFSFYPGKNLGAFGDAGAIVTDDVTLAQQIRSLANHGRASDDPYVHRYRGGNHRLDALQAAVLAVKLPLLDRWNADRRRIVERYAVLLDGLPITMPASLPGATSSHHLAVVRLAGRDALRQRLALDGITTGIHYPIPCHRQVAFADGPPPSLPAAEAAASEILSLPLYPHLSDTDLIRIADSVAAALNELQVDGAPHLAVAS